MIKKILLLLFLLFFCTLFIIYYLIDKIYINNYIKNLEETLKINIYLEEPHQFIVIAHLAFLANFNLDNKEKKLFLKGGEFKIKKNYNRKKAIFNFNSDNIKIDKFIFDNLVTSGEINEYDFNNENSPNLLHWTLGGPWFKDQRTMGGTLAAEWCSARDESMKLWD